LGFSFPPEARVYTKKKRKKARKKEKERISIHAPRHRKPNKAEVLCPAGEEEAGQSTSCSDYKVEAVERRMEAMRVEQEAKELSEEYQ
jgi:hypothetical protein